MKKEIPTWLSHKPILAVDYSGIDARSGAGDAKFLSLGKATWNPEDCSAKVWRYSEKGERWQRQSEELPLWRILDLAQLVVATICGGESGMDEEFVDNSEKQFLKDYINDNMSLYIPRIQKLKELLNLSESKKSSIDNAPNIFSFATSELSQDAMFAYLIKWADPSNMTIDREMCLLGQDFLRLLTTKDLNLQKIDVGRQWKNIDIWAEINDDTILIIEDKTNTSIHDNQLNRYRDIIREEYDGKRDVQYFCYVKTGNEPAIILKTIKEQGYITICRNQILEVLNKYKGNNPLVINYRYYLQEIEDSTQSYNTLDVEKWDWNSWQGFYMELEKAFPDLNWGYVANPSGGFWGAYWHFKSPKFNNNLEMYLQFEQSKLCFKIGYDGNESKSAVRDNCYLTLMEVSKENSLDEIVRPDRFGAGTYMTIGVVNKDDIFVNGEMHMTNIIEKLKKYEKIIDGTIIKIESK